MSFSWQEAEELKKECAKSLRKAKHKASNTNERKRIRKIFSKRDDSKFKTIKGKGYTEWMEDHGKTIEPIEANPDLWEDDLHHTVD